MAGTWYFFKQGIMKLLMREAKNLLLSALLAALGGVSVTAQQVTNINVTCNPGFTIISVPLIASPDNTIGTLFNNAGGTYTGDLIYTYNPLTGLFIFDEAQTVGGRGGTMNTNGWAFAGTNVLAPGVGASFYNEATSPVILNFIGAAPTGSLTNTLVTGYNLVGSILPTFGDLCSNSLMTLTNYNIGGSVYIYANPPGNFTIFTGGYGRDQGGYGYSEQPSGNGGIGDWDSNGDPTTTFIGEGFWYFNSGAVVNWVEHSSDSQ